MDTVGLILLQEKTLEKDIGVALVGATSFSSESYYPVYINNEILSRILSGENRHL